MRKQLLDQQLPAVSVSVYPSTSLYLTFNLLQVWANVSNNSNNPAGFTLLHTKDQTILLAWLNHHRDKFCLFWKEHDNIMVCREELDEMTQ